MAKKYLSDKELQEIINDPTFFDALPTPNNPEESAARNIDNEIDAFLPIIDISMIDEIVKFKNK
nr:unnamed protein product [Callosobruchus chinensis]